MTRTNFGRSDRVHRPLRRCGVARNRSVANARRTMASKASPNGSNVGTGTIRVPRPRIIQFPPSAGNVSTTARSVGRQRGRCGGVAAPGRDPGAHLARRRVERRREGRRCDAARDDQLDAEPGGQAGIGGKEDPDLFELEGAGTGETIEPEELSCPGTLSHADRALRRIVVEHQLHGEWSWRRQGWRGGRQVDAKDAADADRQETGDTRSRRSHRSARAHQGRSLWHITLGSFRVEPEPRFEGSSVVPGSC